MRTRALTQLTLASLLVLSAGDVLARDRDDNRGSSRAMYSEQGRSQSSAREHRDDQRSSGRQEWRGDSRRDNDRHSDHRHRDHDWADRRDRDSRRDWDDRRDWRDRDHRHYRDYDRHQHYYYYNPAPRRVIYVSDRYGHYRHYHLRHDFHSHFYDPFYFHNGVHIHAGCHYHHFGDAIAAGIVIGAILGDW